MTFFAIAIAILSSCKNDDTEKYCDIDITSDPASGLIGGEEFIVKTAVAWKSAGSEKLEIELSNFNTDPSLCSLIKYDYPEETKNYASIDVDRKVGTYNINKEEGIWEAGLFLFNLKDGDEVNTGFTGNCGKVEITQITDNYVRGKVHIDLEDGQNFLKGSFSASICD